jgi:hypothetical protein
MNDQVERGQLSVFRRARLDPLNGRGTVSRRELLLLPVEEELDRGAGLPGELRRGDALGARSELGSESAAHVLAVDPHLGRRDRELLGELVAHPRDPLSRGPDRELVSLPLGDEAVRFERRMGLDPRRVGSLDDDVRLAESLLDVPLVGGARALHVPLTRERFLRGRHVSGGRLRLRVALEDERGGLLAGRVRIHDEGSWLVAHADRLHRVVRALGGVGRDGGDLLAGEANDAPRLPEDQRRPDPGHFLGGGQIDFGDPGRGVGAAENAAVEHAGQPHVDRVARLPGRLGAPVEPRDASSQDAELP